MNPLTELWSQDEPEPFDVAKLKEAQDFRAIIKRRDFYETVTALVLLLIFALIAWRAQTPFARIGAWVVVAACVEVIAALAIARRRLRPELDLAAYADALRTQGTLLRWAWLWYVAPGAGGVLTVAMSKQLSTGHFGLGDLVFLAMQLGFFGWIGWINYAEGTRLKRQVLRDLSA